MEDLKISVIMGIYNCADTLSEAIESILAQTYENWQLIMCDDCSTDNTYEIADSYRKKFPDKIVLLKNDKNSKLSHTLNYCLKYADGEFVARMDGDDRSAPDRFEVQANFLREHPEYMVVGSTMRRFNEAGELDDVKIPEYPHKDNLKKGVPFCHATVMMRKEAYQAVGGYKESEMTIRSQDYDMWFRFYANGFKGYNIQIPLYYVREDLNAVKRRTWNNRINIVKIQFKGYRLIGAPWHWYITPLVQFMKAFVPSAVIMQYREMRGKNR